MPDTPQEVIPPTTEPATPEIVIPPEHVEYYKQIEAKLRLDAEQRLLIWKKTELADLQKETDDKVRDAVAEFWDKWKAEQEPPTPKEIQDMLSQEYVEFQLPLAIGSEMRTFVIRELPQKIERKFYRQFKDQIATYGPQIAAFTQAQMGQTFEKTVVAFMDTFDNAFDIIADGVVLVLNPFDTDKDITREWAQNNISSSRMWNIVQAQIKVNRLRDFFSQLYQAGQSAEMMTTPLSFQGLRERVR